MTDNLEDHVIELQTKLQFQEDSLHKLDDIVVLQAKQIETLRRKVVELEDKLEQLRYDRGQSSTIDNEKPPHY